LNYAKQTRTKNSIRARSKRASRSDSKVPRQVSRSAGTARQKWRVHAIAFVHLGLVDEARALPKSTPESVIRGPCARQKIFHGVAGLAPLGSNLLFPSHFAAGTAPDARPKYAVGLQIVKGAHYLIP
jgi:hypothetical protein